MHKLIIEDDEGKTTVVPLIRDEITIGRKEGNTIRLTERNVSRKHARLLKSNGTIFIEDLQSYNGIKVNGERISGRASIAEGDRIQIGDYQLALKSERSAADEGIASPPIKEEPTRANAPTAAMTPVPAAQATAVGPMPTAPAEDRPARLVVVSSNFAGKEFRLHKPQMVIGRTSDNDVVIAHRSISRHHAKIVRDEGRFQVQDLGSANGVRVNGEEYGKVELRKGDLVDLGHVRLRFVAPGEDFVFARDAKVVDIADGGGTNKTVLIAAIAAAAVVVAIIAVVALGGGKSGSEAGGRAAAASTAAANAAVDRAMKALDWDTAIAEADKGLKASPNDSLLSDKRTKAETEKNNAQIFDAYLKAVKSDDAETAVMKYQEIPENSTYHDKAQESWVPVRKDYINGHLAKARNFQTSGKCDEAKGHVEAVLLVDESNVEAQDLAKKCGHATMPRPRVVRPNTPKAGTPSKGGSDAQAKVESRPEPEPRPVEVRPVAPAAGNADTLVGEAQDDYVRGNYQNAIDKARKALKSDPGNSKAWRIVGASSCFLKDKGGATSAWNRLGNMDRQFLKYVCGRNAITIP